MTRAFIVPLDSGNLVQEQYAAATAAILIHSDLALCFGSRRQGMVQHAVHSR